MKLASAEHSQFISEIFFSFLRSRELRIREPRLVDGILHEILFKEGFLRASDIAREDAEKKWHVLGFLIERGSVRAGLNTDFAALNCDCTQFLNRNRRRHSAEVRKCFCFHFELAFNSKR